MIERTEDSNNGLMEDITAPTTNLRQWTSPQVNQMGSRGTGGKFTTVLYEGTYTFTTGKTVPIGPS